MGNKSTTAANEEEKPDILDGNHHPKLVNAKLMKNKENSHLEVANSISNKELFNRWKNNVKEYSKYQHIESLYLPTNMEFKTEGLCGSSGIVKVSQFLFSRNTMCCPSSSAKK